MGISGGDLVITGSYLLNFCIRQMYWRWWKVARRATPRRPQAAGGCFLSIFTNKFIGLNFFCGPGFLVERALKICKKILKIWKKSGTRVITWGIQKKRPKNSQSWKKIQTHEFVGKNNKKTGFGGLRPPVGGLRATFHQRQYIWQMQKFKY